MLKQRKTIRSLLKDDSVAAALSDEFATLETAVEDINRRSDHFESLSLVAEQAGFVSDENHAEERVFAWVQEYIRALTDDVDQIDADILQRQGRPPARADVATLDHLQLVVRYHRRHVSKLEKLARLLRAGLIDAAKAEELESGVRDYVEALPLIREGRGAYGTEVGLMESLDGYEDVDELQDNDEEEEGGGGEGSVEQQPPEGEAAEAAGGDVVADSERPIGLAGRATPASPATAIASESAADASSVPPHPPPVLSVPAPLGDALVAPLQAPSPIAAALTGGAAGAPRLQGAPTPSRGGATYARAAAAAAALPPPAPPPPVARAAPSAAAPRAPTELPRDIDVAAEWCPKTFACDSATCTRVHVGLRHCDHELSSADERCPRHGERRCWYLHADQERFVARDAQGAPVTLRRGFPLATNGKTVAGLGCLPAGIVALPPEPALPPPPPPPPAPPAALATVSSDPASWPRLAASDDGRAPVGGRVLVSASPGPAGRRASGAPLAAPAPAADAGALGLEHSGAPGGGSSSSSSSAGGGVPGAGDAAAVGGGGSSSFLLSPWDSFSSLMGGRKDSHSGGGGAVGAGNSLGLAPLGGIANLASPLPLLGSSAAPVLPSSESFAPFFDPAALSVAGMGGDVVSALSLSGRGVSAAAVAGGDAAAAVGVAPRGLAHALHGDFQAAASAYGMPVGGGGQPSPGSRFDDTSVLLADAQGGRGRAGSLSGSAYSSGSGGGGAAAGQQQRACGTPTPVGGLSRSISLSSGYFAPPGAADAAGGPAAASLGGGAAPLPPLAQLDLSGLSPPHAAAPPAAALVSAADSPAQAFLRTNPAVFEWLRARRVITRLGALCSGGPIALDDAAIPFQGAARAAIIMDLARYGFITEE